MASKKFRRRVLPIAMAAIMVASCFPAMAAGDDEKATPVPVGQTKDSNMDIYLNYSDGIDAGAYKWVAGELNGQKYYYLVSMDGKSILKEDYANFRGSLSQTEIGVYTGSNVTNSEFQNMKIYVPAEYMSVDNKTGAVTGINYSGVKAGYTAATAPIVMQVNNGSWKSGTSDPKTDNMDEYLEAGMIYVSCGSRSRDASSSYETYEEVDKNGDTVTKIKATGENTGKAPTPVVDLKAGVIALRANKDVIPGDMTKIFSTGNSGAGQMSTILGASGDMEEYYPYLAEVGAIGVTETSSKYSDSILGMYATAQIADIENADMAYAWWRTAETSYAGMGGGGGDFSPFQLQLQADLAAEYVKYLNGLGFDLTLDNQREGTYYNAILQNMTDAINVYLKEEATDPANYIKYLLDTNVEGTPWIEQVSDTEVKVINLDGWVKANGIVSDGTYAPEYKKYDISPTRNKNVPDFDSLEYSGENDAFGKAKEAGVHYSDSVSKVLAANLDVYKTLEGYADYADSVEDYLTIDEYVMYQADLMNAMEILNPNVGLDSETPAKYWRTRNGVQDQHTSFTIAYNSALAAKMAGCEVDYALVWAKEHNDLEKDAKAVAEFVDWVNACVAKEKSSDPHSDADAIVTPLTYTIDGKDIAVTQYTDFYLKNTGDLTAGDYANAMVNVYVPETATSDSPILYMVNNSGWRSNGYEFELLEEGTAYASEDENAAMALQNGYIVVTAGLRSRGSVDSEGNWNHSPVTVADAKAVIRYLRYNEIGDTDKIFITGTSGGGALSVAIGSNGNSKDFYEELYTIGAAGMKSATKSNIADDVYGVIAYCPITDLGHADGSYEYTYAAVRASLAAQGYTAATKDQTFALSKETLEISPTLADGWAEYVNEFGFKTLDGKDLVAGFDADKLTTSGTFPAEVERLLVECLQEALDEMGTEAFVAALESRESAIIEDKKTGTKLGEGYGKAPADDNWKTDWIEIKDGKIVEFDMEGHAEYVALGQILKPAVAFTNKGIPAFDGLMFNENNLFGLEDEEYGYLLKDVYEMSDLDSKYGSWETYWADRAEELTLQAKMVDSIAYLADGEGESDTAPYWWVRHGSNDRDTSFANQTLLYHAMLNNEDIETLDFAFEFGLGHTGGYAVDEVETFMAKSIDGDGYRPVIDNADDGDKDNDGVKDEDEKSPTTADNFGFLAVAVVAAAGLAFAARRRVVR